MSSNRQNFSPDTIKTLQMRAAFICSNPDCRSLTIAPSENANEYVYIGIAAHIVAASEGGPRYDFSMTSEQRKDISNAIFLCASCATMIDKNDGKDFSVEQIKKWKEEHESWLRSNLNKKQTNLTEIAGIHNAIGSGDVVGLRISKPSKIKPGTISTGRGNGKVSGTSIE